MFIDLEITALPGSEIRVREAVCLHSMAFSRHIMSGYYEWLLCVVIMVGLDEYCPEGNREQ